MSGKLRGALFGAGVGPRGMSIINCPQLYSCIALLSIRQKSSYRVRVYESLFSPNQCTPHVRSVKFETAECVAVEIVG